MAHIHNITIDNLSYLIEPTLYGVASTLDSGVNYTVALTDFELDYATGVTIYIKFPVTNKNNNTKLNVNSTGAKDIYYNNAAITASMLTANHIYALTYDGTRWLVVGDINTDKKVSQTPTTTNADYELLFSESANNNLLTEGARKTSTLKYNPNSKILTINGGTLTGTNYSGKAATAGAADTAAAFDSNVTVSLTGDVTGSNSSTKGWSVATTIANGAVTPAKMSSEATIGIGTLSIKVGNNFNTATLLTDLGLSSAMHYRGTSTTIPPESGTYAAGDVLIKTNTSEEYVYDGTDWRELGSESSFKVLLTAVSDPSVPSSGTTTATAFIDTISLDTNGVITVTKKNLPATMTPSSHEHGNITNDGKLSTASRAVVTDGNKYITVASLSVTDSTEIDTTATTFVAKVTQNAIGKITVTKSNLPTASTTVAGITKVGASGGAAAYSHGTHVSYGTSTLKIGTADAGSASTVSRSDHVHAIDLATGDANGLVKIAGLNVSVKGLGDRAFDSTAYLPLTGGTISGEIKFSNTGANKHIEFTRLKTHNGPSYICYPAGGELAIGTATGYDNVLALFDGTTGIRPGKTNTYTLGTSDAKWSSVYATNYYGSAANMTSLTGASSGNYGPSAAVSGTNGTTMNVPYISVDANGRITSISNKVYTAVNTWRGIQDNLESDSTTESLSAAKGKALATGDARDNTKLPLAGGTMTGALKFSGNNSKAITWEDGTWYLRILTTNDSVADTAVFTFQLTSNSGSTWTDLFTIKDNGTVIATTFSGSGASLTSLNASNISSGTLSADRLATSGATAGSYGDSTALTPEYGSTFKVPYITVDNKGRVTGISEHTVKIPASDNTNTTYTIATGDSNGLIKVTPSSGSAYNINVRGFESGYINTHPENSPVLIPFIHNDIAFLTKRGGSVSSTYDGNAMSYNFESCFDGSGSYFSVNSSTYNTLIIILTLHKTFTWTNTIYIDFGSSGWRAKNIQIEVMNSNYTNDTWVSKANVTNNSSGHYYITMNHTPSGASNAGGGFNKIRFTLSSWNSTTRKISLIGIYNYGSIGARETYMSRGIDDTVYRSITPAKNNTYDLGSSTAKWANIYATTFTGTLTGNADTATAWANARKVYVALGTVSKTTTINGGASDAAAIALGIDGTLAVGHGGTGANSANGALVNLFTADTVGGATEDFTDNTIMITSNNSGSTDNWYRRTGIKMWNYIKSKADSVYAGIDALSVANALVYKGIIAGAATSDDNAYGALTPAANCGDTYKVSVAGFINGLRVEVGDMLICTTDNTAAATASNYTTIRNNWNIILTSEGSVSTSSTSSTDNAIVRWDGTSGRIIKSNNYTTLDDNGHISITHQTGISAELQFKYSTTIDYWWGIGTGDVNHGLYDNKASKWILSAGADNTWSFNGNATSATTATNLSVAPSITADGNNIKITAGGKTSAAFTVPYATSAGSVAWENTGHPDTFPPSSHTHNNLKASSDARSTATTPNTYNITHGLLIFHGLKSKATINNPSNDTYSYLIGLRGWSDSSGGDSHELAFNNSGINWRHGATTTWGDWYKILTSANTTAPSSVPTLAWNTESTVFTLNGTGVKIKAMAKPTYAFTDLTSHPTTLSGYGITDAMASSTVVNKVKTTVKSDNVEYKLLMSAGGASLTSGSNYEVVYDTDVTLNPSTHTLNGIKLKSSTRIYPFVATLECSTWYKITFPYSTATTNSSTAKWFMNSFDLHFGGGYSANATGVAHVTFYWSRAKNNGAWTATQVSALMEGIYINKIHLYYRIAEPGILYVKNDSNKYNGIWLDNLFVDDTSPTLDWSTTKIETCSAITDSTNPALSAYTVINTARIYTTDGTQLKTNVSLDFDAEKYIYFRMNRKKSGGGDWAGTYVNWYDNADNLFARIGVFGNADTLSYLFLGAENYNSTKNLKILPSGRVRVLSLDFNETASYGSSTLPIYWNDGVPVECTAYADANVSHADTADTATNASDHIANTSNPHSVTKTQVGLSNVTNDAQVTKAIGTAKGDIIYWSAASTPARLGIGSEEQYLSVISGIPEWRSNNIAYHERLAPDEVAYGSNITYDAHTGEIIRNGGTAGWNTGFYSTIGYKECRVSFRPNSTGQAIMVGLNADPTNSHNYTDIDYCWYLLNGSASPCNIYESGSSISSIDGHKNYKIGDEFAIEFYNGNVYYYHNNVLCRTVARTATTLLYMDSSFHGVSGKIKDLRFTPIGNCNIVSKDAPGLAPKGAAVSSQSTSTKFLREDGTWAVPSYIANAAYGNINTSGQINQSSGWTLASGDGLLVFDSSNSNKIERSGITFDASTTTQVLSKKGTWVNMYTHPTGAGNNHIPSGGSSGQFLKYSSSGVATWSALPTASTSAAGIIQIGTSSNQAMAGNTTVTNVAISADTTANKKYSVVFGTTANDGSNPTAAKTEGLLKNSTKLFYNPSTGSLSSIKYSVDEKVTLEWNSTDLSLDFVFA